jgi:hypothetical protein
MARRRWLGGQRHCAWRRASAPFIGAREVGSHVKSPGHDAAWAQHSGARGAWYDVDAVGGTATWSARGSFARPMGVRHVAMGYRARGRRCGGWGTNSRRGASASRPRGSHGGRARRGALTSCGRLRGFQVALFDQLKLQKFELKCPKI